MQATTVKPVVKTELINKVYEPVLNQTTVSKNKQESKVEDFPKQPNFNRFLEAYSDCV